MMPVQRHGGAHGGKADDQYATETLWPRANGTGSTVWPSAFETITIYWLFGLENKRRLITTSFDPKTAETQARTKPSRAAYL